MVNCVSDRKETIIHLIAGLIKKTLNEIPCIKMGQYIPKRLKVLEEILMLKFIFQIMQQKLI